MRDLPPEPAYLARFKALWYAGAAAALLGTALLVGHIVPTNDYGGWLTWIGDAFQAAYVTVTLLLVVLAYKLVRMSAAATAEHERLNRAARLPIVVADVTPRSGSIGHKVWLTNEGGGPAFDVRVQADYDGDAPFGGEPLARVGVMKKEGQYGPFVIDPMPACIRVSYKDLYGESGFAVYASRFGAADAAFDLVELQLPAARVGAQPAPLHFSYESADATPSTV